TVVAVDEHVVDERGNPGACCRLLARCLNAHRVVQQAGAPDVPTPLRVCSARRLRQFCVVLPLLAPPIPRVHAVHPAPPPLPPHARRPPRALPEAPTTPLAFPMNEPISTTFFAWISSQKAYR